MFSVFLFASFILSFNYLNYQIQRPLSNKRLPLHEFLDCAFVNKRPYSNKKPLTNKRSYYVSTCIPKSLYSVVITVPFEYIEVICGSSFGSSSFYTTHIIYTTELTFLMFRLLFLWSEGTIPLNKRSLFLLTPVKKEMSILSRIMSAMPPISALL